jgi:hypothetical protein
VNRLHHFGTHYDVVISHAKLNKYLIIIEIDRFSAWCGLDTTRSKRRTT